MENGTGRLLVFGLGYSGSAIARRAVQAGWRVVGTSREPGARPPGIAVIPFDSADQAIAEATHLVATAPPGDAGDPVLARYGAAIAASAVGWVGYLSTTGVYGDRGGGGVDEATVPAPSNDRARRRLAAEQAWRDACCGRALDLFRLAGIYGPGRSPFGELRRGTARRIIAPGHRFGRIHRDDIAAAVLAALSQALPAGIRVLNLSDDAPAPSAEVIAEAARLLGMPAPPALPYEEAEPAMSPMARSFWADNRLVRSEATQAALGLRWRYPSFREGLAAILAEETEQGQAQQGEIRRT